MNMALAEWEASNGYPKTENLGIEVIMQALAKAGYNSDNWVCLTAGYEVYWYDIDNRMILYNSTTKEIEYPEDYIGKTIIDASINPTTPVSIMITQHVHVYNENHEKAQRFDMALNTSDVTKKANGKIGGTAPSQTTVTINGVATQVDTFAITSSTTVGGKAITTGTYQSRSDANLQALASTESLNKIAAALSSNNHTVSASNLEMYATKEDVSALGENGSAYASIQICSVAEKDTLTNNGEIKPNVYYIAIGGEKSGEEYIAAKKAAAQYVYNIFDQITTGKIDDQVTILIEGGTVLDCSNKGNDWAPCKTFTGYFGTPDKDAPIIISGANVTSKTGYASTVTFESTNGKYFVTGFFGTIYGKTTIENVKFVGLNIDQPALDYEYEKLNLNTRNTVGLIGGIIDYVDNADHDKATADINIVNVDMSGCSITGLASVGGLVGYIGSTGSDRQLNGTINITDCDIDCNVTTLQTFQSAPATTDYDPCGGIVGFVVRHGTDLNINIKDCSYAGTLTGKANVGVVFGDIQMNVPTANSVKVTITNGDYSGAQFNATNTASRNASLVAFNNKNNVAFLSLDFVVESGKSLKTVDDNKAVVWWKKGSNNTKNFKITDTITIN